MNITKKDMCLYLVTDRKWLKPEQTLAHAVEDALESGVTCVQLREKQAGFEEFLRLAEQLKSVCKKYNVPFIINDNVDIALAVDADGVHIGQDDMGIKKRREILGPYKIIGTSTHNVQEALQAVADGADYIGCGAVFGSGTKKDASFLGVPGLKEICRAVDIPKVAIGGITAENIFQLKGTGVNGVAVVSAILAQNDISAAAKQLYQLSKEL